MLGQQKNLMKILTKNTEIVNEDKVFYPWKLIYKE